jgi:Na+/H+ antiporter NhaB
MGYFDALTSSSFKTTEDGRRLFFPWGTMGRGYRVESEEQFQRLQRQVKTYLMVSLPLSIAAVVLLDVAVTIVVVAVVMAAYAAWAGVQCRQLTKSADRLTFNESVANQAREHSIVVLWLLMIGALALVAGGVFILVVEPDKWLLGLVSIAFFGFAAFMVGRMLVLKRRAARGTRF